MRDMLAQPLTGWDDMTDLDYLARSKSGMGNRRDWPGDIEPWRRRSGVIAQP